MFYSFQGHLIARELYIDGTSFPVFPLGIYMFSLTIRENFHNRSSEGVGTIKYYFEVMEMVKSKKRNPRWLHIKLILILSEKLLLNYAEMVSDFARVH